MATSQILKPTDRELEEAIARVIEEKGLYRKVEALVKDGYVHLLGLVDGLEMKKKISESVEAVSGVRIVTNHIRVLPWVEKGAGTHF